MICVGIDVSKSKSTVCAINEYGEIIKKPITVNHTVSELKKLSKEINSMGKDVKVVMEATGIYHLPILKFLKDDNHFISVINPLKMKAFSKNVNFRSVKTDKIDSKIISMYGIEKWYSLKNSLLIIDEREELKTLARTYVSHQKPKVQLKLLLDAEIEKTMPGIKKILTDDIKLFDFINEFYHFELIRKLSEDKFLKKFRTWAKKKNHKFHNSTPIKIYELSKEMVPVVPCNDTNKLTITTVVNNIRIINKGLEDILSQMNAIASKFPEYEIIINIPGVGETLAPLIIAEIGDIRKYLNKKSLVCMAGIDVPPYESGKFTASKCSITKKGNKYLRRHLYLVMTAILVTKPKNDSSIYDFMIKKQAEHKHYKQVRVAGMRKFLHIYYARVKEKYKALGIWDS